MITGNSAVRILPERGQHLKAVKLRQLDVEEHYVGDDRAGHLKPGLTVGGDPDGVPFLLQLIAIHPCDGGIVLDKDDARVSCGGGLPPGPGHIECLTVFTHVSMELTMAL